MTSDDRYTVIETATGEVLDVHPEVAELKVQVRQLERERRGQRLKVANLEAKLDEKRRQDPKMPEARALFRHYVATFGKSKSFAFDPKRQDLILGALKMVDADGEPSYTTDQLRDAISGRKLKSWCGPKGWQADEYPGARQYDGLEHCLGNADRIDDGIAELKKAEAQAAKDAAMLEAVSMERARRRREMKRIDRVIEAMNLRGCKVEPLRAGGWAGRCPAQHQGHAEERLTIRESPNGGVEFSCSDGRCTAIDVCEGLDILYASLLVRPKAAA